LRKILARLSHQPTGSIPEVTASASEAQSIYRFWSNPKVSAAAILNGHIAGTLSRIQPSQSVLAIQDTTDLDFTRHPATEGLGYINQTSQQGVKVHTTFAVSGAGEPLGLLGQDCWVRETPPTPKKERPAAERNANKPIEQKESNRWLVGLRASEAAVPASRHLVHVGDREADIFELFAQPRGANSDVLIRAKSNRKLNNETGKLFDAVARSPVLGEVSITVRRSPQRGERHARLTLRARSVRLEVPEHLPKQQLGLRSIAINILLVEETTPPDDGGKPICWRLLTTLPLDSVEQACQCVQWYSYRWLIERFHYTLKSGCKMEALQLRSCERLLNALATYSIVAWRLMAMTYRSRLTPDVSCEVLFSAPEWRLLRRKFNPKSRAKRPPTLQQAMIWLARLGGFANRKGDGPPGIKTLWRGYAQLSTLLEGVQLARKSPR